MATIHADEPIADTLRRKLGNLRRIREGWERDVTRLELRVTEAREKMEEYGREIADVQADCARLGISLAKFPEDD